MTKKASTKQMTLPSVKVPAASSAAERYADIVDDIAVRKDELKKQEVAVVEEMRKAGMTSMTFTDSNGYKHFFTIISGVTKLKHSKREEA